jgi:hypothetical protein
MSVHPIVSPIVPYSGSLLCSFQEIDRNGLKQTCAQSINLAHVKAIPKGYGGRIGVLPYFVKDNQLHVLLNRSNRNLISDFGGGVRATLSPYQGLLKELAEEVPFWKDYLEQEMNYGETMAHTVETYYPLDEQRSKQTLRTWTTIFVQVDPSILEHFQTTKEVKELLTVPMMLLPQFLAKKRNQINSGLNMLLKYYYFV